MSGNFGIGPFGRGHVGTPAWAVDRSDKLASWLVEPPRFGPDVCRICHGWVRPGYSICFVCRMTRAAVAHPCDRVSVISLYRPGTTLHQILRGYKDESGPAQDVRRGHVAGLIARHLWEHGSEIAPSGWNALVVVPSSSGRIGPHPLEVALAGTFLGAQVWPELLVAGPVPAGHRRAEERGFVVNPGADAGTLAGSRLVVVDDTWTTGARAQSAASVLRGAGASVEAIVALGRVVTPVVDAPSGRWWLRHASARAQEKALSSPTPTPRE